MRSFAKDILKITGLLLVLNFIIHFSLLSSKELYWDQKKLNSKKFVAFGDSHPMYALGYNEKTPFAEYCWMSDSFADVKMRLAYLEENHRFDSIELFIIQADPYMFTRYRDMEAVDDFRTKSPGIWDMYFPLFFNKFIANDIRRALVTKDNLRYAEKVCAVTAPFVLAEDQLASRFGNQYELYSAISLASVGYFNEVVLLLRERQKHIVAIKYPVCSGYRRMMDESPAYRRTEAYGDSLFRKLQIPVLDLRSSAPDELFKDPDHLNCIGSGEFIRILEDSIKSIHEAKSLRSSNGKAKL